MVKFILSAVIFISWSAFGEGTSQGQAPPAQAHAQTITVSAAASLSDVLPQVASSWKVQSGNEVKFNFDGSSRLANQIENGAPVDVFFSADEDWMDYLAKAKKIIPETRRSILSNQLVVIVPKGSKHKIKKPKDLVKPEIEKVALAGQYVPALKYAMAAFKALKIDSAIMPKAVQGDNVRTALNWVAKGEADAGVVYYTDALTQSLVKIAAVFDAKTYPKISYPMAVINNSEKQDAARSFLAFCESKAAKKIFKRFGFLVIEGKNK